MKYVPLEANPKVFFDITAEGNHLGRVTIELFSDAVPQTAENFRSLCTGERGYGRWVPSASAKVPLFYKGIPFHRIIPGFVVQGGDILHRDGRGNESVFGYPFRDESFEGKAGKHLEGTVAMAQSGPNQNGSQFFINVKRSSHLDGKFVVVGQVIDGWDVVQEIGRYGSRCGVPVGSVWISECGQSGGLHEDTEIALGGPRAPFMLPGKEVLEMLRPR